MFFADRPKMSDTPADPLSDVVTLLQPRMAYSKLAGAAGRWRWRREACGEPMYALIVEGQALMEMDGLAPVVLQAGDFILVPSTQPFTMGSLEPPPADEALREPVQLPDGQWRVGDTEGQADARMLSGYCELGSPDTALLVSLLPRLVHVRGEPRLGTLVQLVVDEFRTPRPARDMVLQRLLELLLVEALRSSRDAVSSPGLLRALTDERLALALRGFHAAPREAWSVSLLAGLAAMSRSTFFSRFTEAVGVPPMEYVLAWRMALAKRLLKHGARPITEVASQVGYSSPSTFTVAFTRHVGMSPGKFARST
jgi:AraC-like DNA-binding protein